MVASVLGSQVAADEPLMEAGLDSISAPLCSAQLLQLLLLPCMMQWAQ